MEHNVIKQRSGCIFVSHASADNKDKKIKKLCDILEQYSPVFCSSVPKSSISLGSRLFNKINKNITDCRKFIAIITDNYLRSQYCLYEYSVARYLKKTIIPIFSSEEVELKMRALADKDVVNLIANNDKEICLDAAEKLLKTLKLSNQNKENIAAFLQKLALTTSAKPYIGMTQNDYNKVLRYCDEVGIVKIGKGALRSGDEIKSKFATAKKIYFLSTTGAGLLKSVKEIAIPLALKNNAEINIIIPDKDSVFCEDVALAECKQDGFGNIIEEQNKKRIHSEFDSVFQYLNEAYWHIKKSTSNAQVGTITCYCSQTLLRQTILLAIDENDNAWGWTTMTMPPLRTTDCPSFAVEGKANTSFIKLMMDYCESIKSIAIDRGEYCSIDGSTISNHFNNRNIDRKQYWEDKRSTAVEFMRKRRKSYSNILIEVAAQHPLYNGRTPNEEFMKRLDSAILLRKSLQDENTKVYIYVPGSRHSYNGIDDEISLSQAGREYLISRGVNEDFIYADKENVLYKGDDGVYNSADECYVSSLIFKNEKFGRLICVCSPYQIMRKTFFYLEQGIMPECYGISSEDMFHDIVSEYFNSLWVTVFDDPDWQDKINSEMYINSRRERMPIKHNS